MKKLIVFLLILAMLFPTLAFKNDKNPLFLVEGLEKVCFVSSCEIEDDGFENVQSGDLYFNFCGGDIAELKYDIYKKDAEAVQFYYKNIELFKLFDSLKFDIVEECVVEQVQVYFGYSPYLSNSFLYENKKVNLQFAITDGYVIVGYPIILTGF